MTTDEHEQLTADCVERVLRRRFSQLQDEQKAQLKLIDNLRLLLIESHADQLDEFRDFIRLLRYVTDDAEDRDGGAQDKGC